MSSSSHWREIPGIGRVPQGPRADRVLQRNRSPSPWPLRPRRSPSPRRSHQASRSSRLTGPSGRNETRIGDDPRSISRFASSESENFLQHITSLSERSLRERFIKKRQQMSDVAQRQNPAYGHRTRQNAQYRDQSLSSSRDECQPCAIDNVEIKREDHAENEQQDLLFIPESSPTESSGKDTEPSSSGGEGGQGVNQPQAHRDGLLPPPRNFSLPGRVSADCICPIGFECPAKHDLLIDCRSLVLEHQHWNWIHRTDTVPM